MVFKPITGVLDLASASADGFINMVRKEDLSKIQKRYWEPRTFYTNKKKFDIYNSKRARINSMMPTKTSEGFNIIGIERVNNDLDDLIICLEGILLMCDKKITFWKNVSQLIGAIENEQIVSIEYFE